MWCLISVSFILLCFVGPPWTSRLTWAVWERRRKGITFRWNLWRLCLGELLHIMLMDLWSKIHEINLSFKGNEGFSGPKGPQGSQGPIVSCALICQKLWQCIWRRNNPSSHPYPPPPEGEKEISHAFHVPTWRTSNNTGVGGSTLSALVDSTNCMLRY